jgi:N-acetylglutamate synthase-like GNAT family acetyltransferase
MVSIRRAQVQDSVHMHQLQQLAFQEEGRRCSKMDIPPLTEQVSEIAAHVETQIALVAEHEGAIVGCVRGVVDGPVCTVRGLVVDPGHQGNGIGSMLLRALEGSLQGVHRIDLTTNTIMEGNEPFYVRHGYSTTSHTIPAPGIKLVHMSKAVASDA